MLQFPVWKKALIALVCLIGVLYAAPNFFEKGRFDVLPDFLPGKSINLGLDLQGGVHLLLGVETDSVIRDRLDSVVDLVRNDLREQRIGYRNLGVDGQSVVFTLREPDKKDEVRKLILGDDKDLLSSMDDSGKFTLTLKEKAVLDAKVQAVQQSVEVIRRRIDETGTKEPIIQQQGEDRILVQVPGVKDPDELKRKIGKTAKMTFHLVDMNAPPASSGHVPPGDVVMEADRPGPGGQVMQYVVKKRIEVSGEHLTDAQPSFQNNAPVVSFRFDSLGAKKFGEVTRDHVGDLLAIVLDGKVISAPRIQSPILGGAGVITGQFTVQEVQELSLLLRAGALPAPIKVLEERTVGPGLGQDSIDAGKLASLVGFSLVVLFMLMTYGRFGFYANLALIINLVLIVAALSGLQATLTLPGIAGIVLTVGMAVDANVLIFERIREEFRAGRSVISSIESGYKRALATIIDSNLTTLIAAVLLYAFGSGPIRGFAVTLSIGIVTSMFTAIMVTRVFVVMWLRRTRPQKLPI